MSFVYDWGRQAWLLGQVNWVGDTVRAYLVDSQEYSTALATAQSTHDHLDDVPVGGRVASADLTNKTAPLNNGVADADNVTFTNVAGDVSEYIILVQIVSGGTEADHRLLALMDSATTTGLPVTPNGGDIVVQWSDLANRILKL